MEKHAVAAQQLDTLVIGQTGQRLDFQATLLRLKSDAVVFEIYGARLGLHTSEVLSGLSITAQGKLIYSGKVVVRSLVETASALICEAVLESDGFQPGSFGISDAQQSLPVQFEDFFGGWQKRSRILGDYRIVVADLRSFLCDIRLWLDQTQIGFRSLDAVSAEQRERAVLEQLGDAVMRSVDGFVQKLESIADNIEEEWQPVHRAYLKRELHPLLLCSPFAHRTYVKPLGYSGDYEMVNMMVRDPYEGNSLFARLINRWFLQLPPVEAHRNRIGRLQQKLLTETARVVSSQRRVRILNIGCGPAVEVQNFIRECELANQAELTLIDFNEETIEHVKAILHQIRREHQRSTAINFVRKSVYLLLRETNRAGRAANGDCYDFIYCAGLFDYLPDYICQGLMNILYDRLAPGGLLLTTNVDASNPLRQGMEHLLEWHLVYRTAPQMQKLKPGQVPMEDACVRADLTGVNLFMEVRKPYET